MQARTNESKAHRAHWPHFRSSRRKATCWDLPLRILHSLVPPDNRNTAICMSTLPSNALGVVYRQYQPGIWRACVLIARAMVFRLTIRLEFARLERTPWPTGFIFPLRRAKLRRAINRDNRDSRSKCRICWGGTTHRKLLRHRTSHAVAATVNRLVTRASLGLERQVHLQGRIARSRRGTWRC